MAESIILDASGKPLQKTDLSTVIAEASLSGVRNVWGWSDQAEFISPDRLGRILRDAVDGDADAYLTLCEEMEERDPHYGAVLGTRKRAITGLESIVEAATDDQKDIEIADAVRVLIRRPEYGDMLDALLDALGKGYSVVEMNWDTTNLPWEPRDRDTLQDGEWKEQAGYSWRDPRFFQFDRVTGRELRIKDESNLLNGLPIPRHRFIIHRPNMKCGLPIRGGLGRLVAIAYMCKAYTLTDWVAFAEVFGMPLRIGKYSPGATRDDINTLINAVANIGTDAAAVIPESMRIEFESAGTSSGGPDMFLKLAEYLDKQISKAVLGQTATTEGTPGKLGSDDAQSEVREDILRSDKRQLENTINKYLVRSFVDLNYGQQEQYPLIKLHITDNEDVTALVDNTLKLIPYGLRVEESVIRDKLGLPDPAKDAILLQPAPALTAAQNHEHHEHCSCCKPLRSAMNVEQQDDIDELEAAALEGWQKQTEPLLQSIRDLADASETAEDFVRGLQDLADDISDDQTAGDATALISSLADAMFKARGIGDATDGD
ncbi:MAG: hypothetical protein CMI13_11220 [Oleibacter sp.]|nr:hypothetical protein [Thalassolituus sp.]